jgi:hypothetical protein
MRTIKSLLAVLLTGCLLLSCQDDEKTYFVDEQLTPYVDAFFEEGTKRGVVVNRENLIAQTKTLQSIFDAGIDRDGQRYLYFNKVSITQMRQDQVEATVISQLAKIILNKGPEPGEFSLTNPDRGMAGYTDENYQPCASCREQLLDKLFK